MGMIRVYQMAKELGLSSKELLARLNEAGLVVKSHASTVDKAKARAILALPDPVEQNPHVETAVVAEGVPQPVKVEPTPMEVPPPPFATPERSIEEAKIAEESTNAAAKVNELLFEPVAKVLEVASNMVQGNTKLLQEAITLEQATLQAGRKYVETAQQASWDGVQALIQLGTSTTRAALQWVEDLQASLRGSARKPSSSPRSRR